jgi:N-acetylneuraminic acid mutarotase
MEMTGTEVAAIDLAGTVGSWTAMAPLPSARDRLAAIAYQGRIYVVGGSDDNGFLDEVLIGQIGSDGHVAQWATGPRLPAGRQSCTLAVDSGWLYVLGGRVGATYQTQVLGAPIGAGGQLGSWVTLASGFTVDRVEHASVNDRGFLTVLGGYDYSGYLDSVEQAAAAAGPSLGTWSGLTPLPFPYAGQGAVATRGFVFLLGGITTAAGTDNRVWFTRRQQDGSLGPWQGNTQLPLAVRYAAAFAYHGSLYVLAGHNPQVYSGALQ